MWMKLSNLAAVFNSDDLRGCARLGAIAFDLLDHVHAADHLSEDNVLNGAKERKKERERKRESVNFQEDVSLFLFLITSGYHSGGREEKGRGRRKEKENSSRDGLHVSYTIPFRQAIRWWLCR